MYKYSRKRFCAAILFVATVLTSCGVALAQSPKALYKSSSAPLEARVNDLFGQLNSDEKISLLSLSNPYSYTRLVGTGVPRLGLAGLFTTDGPQAIRSGTSTSFPMGVVMASTWDPPLINEIGAALGEEARALGDQILFGPCINMQRSPQGGRYFENFSEDPFIASQFTVAYITGVQSQGVISCPKHYFGNDQEYGRHSFSTDMDERTMREIYLPTFRSAVVDAHAWAVMTSFNKVNGVFLSDSKAYVNDVLRNEFHWDGAVVGDAGSIHDTALSMNAGLDLEIPSTSFYGGPAIAKSIVAGNITQDTVDQAVKRLLRMMIRAGLADDPPSPQPTTVDSPEHRAIALKTAEAGITLLKNEGGILPLDRAKIKWIAVIGPHGNDTQLGGRWSADTRTFYKSSVLDGIQAKSAAGTVVAFAQGCNRTGATPDAMIQEAVALAAKSDVAIVVVGTDNNYLGEELDPPNLYLPGSQEKLIQSVAAVNKNTIVILNNGMPILMDRWLKAVHGLVEGWYAGQDQGNAIAEILFGDVNPSGHLTGTIALHREDYSDWPNYPGVDSKVEYAEGIYVGYRHFDKANIAPLYAFGFGLSYTSFQMRRLKLPRDINRGEGSAASVTVKNTGKVTGDEVVQLYVRDLNPQVDRPVCELKGFQRIHLASGDEKQVTIPIGPDAFSYWDTGTHAWKTTPGGYEIEIGDSSRNILAAGKVNVR